MKIASFIDVPQRTKKWNMLTIILWMWDSVEKLKLEEIFSVAKNRQTEEINLCC